MINFIISYTNELTSLTNEMAPWLLLGIVFAGLLKVFFPQEKVQTHMGKPNTKSAVKASLLGVPMPLCSCGVIPTGISFYKNGASKGAVNSFLISTPQTGLDSIFATYSMMGLPFAILRPIIAFFTGVMGGVLTNKFVENNNQKVTNNIYSNNYCNDSSVSKENKWFSAFKYAFIDLLQDIAKWLIIGLLVAAFISVLTPEDFFLKFRQYPILELFVILLISVPMYVCATGSIPIATILLIKGISPGAALVFLMAGPATNLATITVVGNVMGRKSLIIYLLSIIGGAIFFGILTNWLIPSDFIMQSIPNMQNGKHSITPHWIELSCSAILIFTIIFGYLYNKKNKKTELKKDSMIQIKVDGMTCSHCETSIKSNLLKINGIRNVIPNKLNSTIVLEGNNIDLKAVEITIKNIGYSYKGEIK